MKLKAAETKVADEHFRQALVRVFGSKVACGRSRKFEGTVEGSSNLKEEGSIVITLLIRHLPDAIPLETLSRLFSHYGACAVRPGTSGRLKNCAFIDFKSEAVASQAQRQLHGLRFLGKVLSVERAKKQEDNSGQAAGGQVRKDVISSQSLAKETTPRLGIEYPFPPHLEYAYPPPDGNILTNIVNALIAVPRFYTQVLHLMNKMNIPAPFRIALPTPPLPPSVPAPPPPPPPAVVEKPLADLSSDESEMESSDEETVTYEAAKKRMRTESIVGPAVDKDVAHETVGLRPATLVPKEMPMIKKKNPVLQIKITQKPVQNDQKDEHTSDAPEETDTEKECPAPKPFASAEDLESGKLPPEEILSLPCLRFNNYSAGNPAPVLYIKNLSKDVVPSDFYFLFGSLFGDLEMIKSSVTVKLMQVTATFLQCAYVAVLVNMMYEYCHALGMLLYKSLNLIIDQEVDPYRPKNVVYIICANVQLPQMIGYHLYPCRSSYGACFSVLEELEGRMRGQAFVTFPSTELAHQALNLANGYVFKSKPMIIQFAATLPPQEIVSDPLQTFWS
ncbi:unnamed protein product [Rhodiola kirilowii]